MSMSREQAKALLGENATEEQITAVLDKFHEEQKELKAELAAAKTANSTLQAENKDLQGYKTKYDESEKAKLSDQERMALKEKELDEKLKKVALKNNAISAKSILVGAGISDERAEALVASIVKEKEEDTIAAANLLAQEFSSIKETTAKTTREQLANLDLKPNPSNKAPDSKPMDWNTFTSMSQEEQDKFIKEHPEEFQKL